jgi:parallel beta-helix repeat protein
MLAIVACPDLSAATTFYVAKNGNDANSGTLSKPFLTINRAAKLTRPGDTILVRSGIYKERVTPYNSGGRVAYISYQPYQTESVTIDASGLQQGFILWKVSRIRIAGFKVINAQRSGIHIQDHKDTPDAGSDHNIIAGNVVENNGTAGYNGIYIGGHDNRVTDNEVRGNGYINGAATPQSGHGVYLAGNGNFVEGNNIYSNARMGIRMEGNGNTITDNDIHLNMEYGLSIWVDAPFQANGISIQKNLIVNNVKGGIRIHGEGSGAKPDNIFLYNNTITNSAARDGIYVSGGATNIKIKNNIIKGSYSGVMLGAEDSITGYEEDYNIVSGSGMFVFGSQYFNSFEQYRLAVAPNSQSSLNQDPLLQQDYSLSPGSPAIDNGTYVGLPFMGSAPDIGAVESSLS